MIVLSVEGVRTKGLLIACLVRPANPLSLSSFSSVVFLKGFVRFNLLDSKELEEMPVCLCFSARIGFSLSGNLKIEQLMVWLH